MRAIDILRRGPVIPVLSIARVQDALPLAKALLAGGIDTLEITLRTDAALDVIRQLRKALPDVCTGAGSVRTQAQFRAAADAGAQFIISPGATPDLFACAASSTLPFIPGVASVSEAMQAADHGLTALKFFPAEASGGPAMLKAWHAPLPDLMFCPTGGIRADNAMGYLSLPNVCCVGGSWLVTTEDVVHAAWDRITAKAQQASQLRQVN